MIVQLHIPVSNSTEETKKKKKQNKNKNLKNKKNVFLSHDWKTYTIYCHFLTKKKKKGNFSRNKVLPWYVPLSLEREQGTYVKGTCHLPRSVGMYVSVCQYKRIRANLHMDMYPHDVYRSQNNVSLEAGP